MKIIFSLSLLICLVSFATADNSSPALITVVGEGDVVVPPDYADITIGVTLQDPTAQNASNRVDDISANIIAYLKDNGVADQDIQTSFVSVSPNYDYSVTPPTTNGYTATKTVDFSLRDLSKYDDVVQGLFAVGANTINNVQFQADNTDQKLETARSRAAQNARAIAENLAKSLGVSVGGVFSINDLATPDYFPISYAAGAEQEEASNAETSGPSIAGGVLTITARVQVQFFIADGSTK